MIMKILIAEAPGPFRDALREELKRRHTLICCDGGKAALEQLRKEQPDILILDLGISEYDGLSVLQAAYFCRVRPRTLVMSRYLSDHIISQIHRFGVDNILLKPVTVCAAVAQINALICECEKEDVSDRYRKIHQLLHLLGFRRCCAGYDCMVEAMYQVRYNALRMVTKEVYPTVAKLCGGTPCRVEKAIRDSIRDAWSRRDEEIWRMFFPVNRCGTMSCPRNTEFLLAFAEEYITQEKKANVL